MRVHVDEAGRDVEPGRVDLAGRARTGQVPHRDDLAPGNAHIRHERRVSGPVQHPSPSNQQVEGLGPGGEGNGDGEQDGERKVKPRMGRSSPEFPELPDNNGLTGSPEEYDGRGTSARRRRCA